MFLLAQIAVVLAFAVIVVYSKHLHIVAGPGERPVLPPAERARARWSRCAVNGKVLDFEEADPDTDVFGLGKIEDFTWKGLLDMAHLHRVRAVPVPVPGLGDRQAAVPQAGHPGPARPRVRQGPLPARRLRRGAREAARRGEGRGRARRWSAAARTTG